VRSLYFLQTWSQTRPEKLSNFALRSIWLAAC
jgi:hypothetical protein